ncbi:MAG TPA: TRAP transporter substrate-binding protein DctP [Burkholderiales bacterium]
MISKTFRLALFGIVSAIMIGQPASVFAQTMWKGYTFFSATNHPDYQHLEKMANEFARLSGGKITTKVSVGGSLPIPSTAVTQAVGEGTLTFAHDGFFTGNLPIGALPTLPMLMRTHEDFRKSMEILEPYMSAELAKNGVTLLATYNFPLQTIWGVSKITTIADLKSKKMRVGNLPTSEFMRRFGATPVTLGTPDVAPALERSTVEGLVTASAGGGRLWGDLLKYNYRLSLYYDPMLVIVNKKAFDKLSPDLQKKFRDAARKDAAELTQELADSEDDVTAKLKAKGMVVTVPGDAERKEATDRIRDYWDQWAKSVSPSAVEALAKIRAAIKQ